MASDETVATDVFYEDVMVMDQGFDHHHNQTHLHQSPHKCLSRLSTCCTSNDDEDGGSLDTVYHNMSRLSIESFEDGGADADEELSDEKEEQEEQIGRQRLSWGYSSSDSDKDQGFSSLPSTPPQQRRRSSIRGGASSSTLSRRRRVLLTKDYASENDAQSRIQMVKRYNSSRRRRSQFSSERWADQSSGNDGVSCDSEGGLMVITMPKGGTRSLCMDLEEVKACRDLGFELEHQRMFEMPSRLSISASNLDTSSGGDSPISSIPISSPGDDPRDVKARLKVWAQAVAIASSSRQELS